MNILQLCINKSGNYQTVYSAADDTKKIGTLYPDEAFIDYGSESGNWHMVYFRDPNGKLACGEVKYANKLFTPCTTYPYGTVTIDGTKYKTYKIRSQRNVYTANGNGWGAVAGNMLVATNDATTGLSHFDWKAVNYVKSTSGKWVKVEGDGYNYGFVDIGLSQGSMPSNINLYGSW